MGFYKNKIFVTAIDTYETNLKSSPGYSGETFVTSIDGWEEDKQDIVKVSIDPGRLTFNEAGLTNVGC